jgi:hypothetical protein
MIRKMLKKIHDEEGQFTSKDLCVDGNDLIQEFKLPPSKIIGELLQQSLDRVLNDIKNRNNKEEIFNYL